jgi:hypothetical protein
MVNPENELQRGGRMLGSIAFLVAAFLLFVNLYRLFRGAPVSVGSWFVGGAIVVGTFPYLRPLAPRRAIVFSVLSLLLSVVALLWLT